VTALPAWYGQPAPGQLARLRELARLPAGPPLTAALRLPGLARSVTAVIPTFNRCPFGPGRLADNPLYWAVTTLQAQAGDALAEIIVVDDGSDDHTAAALAALTRRRGGIPVRAVRLAGRAGAWHARNVGAAAARGRWLFFADDDCVFPPHAIAGAARVLADLARRDPAAGAVMTPCYYRSARPSAVLPDGRIGVLDIEAADFATGWHAVPASRLARPPALGPSGLLAALPVALTGGTALIDRAALAAAGGFADLSAWESGYSDHLHLSADLARAGAALYHCPDPRLGAAHLKFGAAGRYPAAPDAGTVITALGRPLADLAALSAAPRGRTGHRLPDAHFYPEQIGSFFAFFAARSLAGGEAWALRSWREFVAAGQPPTLAVAGVPPLPERIAAWRAGLARGAAALAVAGPPGTRREVGALLGKVTGACGQPPVTW
jgi:hypothetical protein